MIRHMTSRILSSSRPILNNFVRHSSDQKDDRNLSEDVNLRGIELEDIDSIMSDSTLRSLEGHYPNLDIEPSAWKRPLAHEQRNVMVIQPWVSYSNFDDHTDPEIQLQECVSLANTISNWTVVDRKILFANQLNRKTIIGSRSFEELKQSIMDRTNVNAVFFGLELLSGMQLSTIEKAIKIPVYDRFTVVLNIFRQHARSKEAKIQVALAELPYIRSHLREIHESSDYSSAADSIKLLIGGASEKFYNQRMSILKRRELRLRYLLEGLKKQRELKKKKRKSSDVPIVSVVGYTNCGKTSLIKYLTADSSMTPKDQLFATLDVTVHTGQLPSSKCVLYMDTVGFLSRIPNLLIEAFEATLKEVHESDLILHLLDVGHPDHRLQNATVIRALESLSIRKELLNTKLTIGNKCDLIDTANLSESLPKCDMMISVTGNNNMDKLVELVDKRLSDNLRHDRLVLRVSNGGEEFSWLLKNATMTECEPDKTDENYLVCRVIMSQAASGRFRKIFGRMNMMHQ